MAQSPGAGGHKSTPKLSPGLLHHGVLMELSAATSSCRHTGKGTQPGVVSGCPVALEDLAGALHALSKELRSS